MLWDRKNLWVHVGRSTNGWLLWAVDPWELEAMEQAGCMPYYEDGTPVTWYRLWQWIYSQDHYGFDLIGQLFF